MELWMLVNTPFYEGNGELLKKLKTVIAEANSVHSRTVTVLLLEYKWDWLHNIMDYNVPSPLHQAHAIFSKEATVLKFGIFLEIRDINFSKVAHCKIPSTPSNIAISMLLYNLSISEEPSFSTTPLWHLSTCKKLLSHKWNDPPKVGLIPAVPGAASSDTVKYNFWKEMHDFAEREQILMAFNSRHEWEGEHTGSSKPTRLVWMYVSIGILLILVIITALVALWYVLFNLSKI